MIGDTVMAHKQPDKLGRYITKNEAGIIEERGYNPSTVSNRFAVGERIEWVENIGDTEAGPTQYYQSGIIKKITPWTVLLEVHSGKELRLGKAYLENRAWDSVLAEAIQASMETAMEDEHAKKRFHPVSTLAPGANEKQCFRCKLSYPLEAFESGRPASHQSLILSETCPDCYRKTKSKISTHNSVAKKHGGQIGLTPISWLEKLKASQGCCSYCKRQYEFEELIIEHVIPLVWGGNNTQDNVEPTCIGCNSSKGDRDYHTWQRHLEAQRLLEQLQKHLGLSAFEVKNLAIKKLAESLGITAEAYAFAQLDGKREGGQSHE